jgi:catechol 2,3-dioxygenase-like lactoylglutathione lyase family enzyme
VADTTANPRPADAAPTDYPFIEVSLACSDAAKMERFWQDMFDGQTIFRGRMLGYPFVRMIACGITLVFREYPGFEPPPGPGKEFRFENHLGLRVPDLEQAIADLEARGAQFVLTPAKVREFQKMRKDDGQKYLETDYMAPPLTAERLAAGDFRIDVAILVGPDNLWVELNEIHEPDDTQWFPGGQN